MRDIMALIEEDAILAVTECLNALVMQLIDMNTSMAEIHSRLTKEGVYMSLIVDELRTLNAAAGRIEDGVTYRP
jgi:hypothetical protein